jgi:RNA polymerase sigma-70 factor (ECF subfamily)
MAREEVIQKAYALSQVAIIEETSPAEELERKYYFLVNKAIGLLPDYQQKIYLLSRKMEYKEITVQMNIPYVTVKRCIQYSRLSISNYVRSHMEPCLIALLLATPVVDDVVYLN